MFKKEDIEEIKQEMKIFDLEDLAEVIREEPLIKGKREICLFKKEQKKELKEKLHEIACLVLELSQLEQEFLEENFKNFKNIKCETFELKGDFEQAIKQLEKLDIPKEVKEVTRKELFKIFHK